MQRKSRLCKYVNGSCFSLAACKCLKINFGSNFLQNILHDFTSCFCSSVVQIFFFFFLFYYSASREVSKHIFQKFILGKVVCLTLLIMWYWILSWKYMINQNMNSLSFSLSILQVSILLALLMHIVFCSSRNDFLLLASRTNLIRSYNLLLSFPVWWNEESYFSYCQINCMYRHILTMRVFLC